MPFQFDTEEEQVTRKAALPPAEVERAVGSDNEIALGTRSLLGIFFGLALICAVFFGFGYSMGRAGGSRAASQPSETATPAPASHAPKPSPELISAPATTDQSPTAQAPGSGPAPQPASTQTQVPVTAPKPVASAPAPMPATQPTAVMQPAAATPGSAFMVQVAAVRIQQDAEILVDALKRHGYSAVVRNEPQDQLLHIQLGPFTSRADANAMRAKLLADGYNAVIK